MVITSSLTNNEGLAVIISLHKQIWGSSNGYNKVSLRLHQLGSEKWKLRISAILQLCLLPSWFDYRRFFPINKAAAITGMKGKANITNPFAIEITGPKSKGSICILVSCFTETDCF